MKCFNKEKEICIKENERINLDCFLFVFVYLLGKFLLIVFSCDI